jgi:diguanylate cyclase (GGDEF)-like protein
MTGAQGLIFGKMPMFSPPRRALALTRASSRPVTVPLSPRQLQDERMLTSADQPTSADQGAATVAAHPASRTHVIFDLLADLLTPRSLPDGIARAAVLLAAINVLNWFSLTYLSRLPFHLVDDTVNTTIVALPFVGLILSLLHRQRRLQDQLLHLATTDMLTGLPNRRAFLARAATLKGSGRTGSLLILDIDHFKRVNDTYGHAVGDACLRAVANRLRQSLRAEDIVGRIGGEEFCVFLPGATEEEARQTGLRLCRAVAFEPDGEHLVLRVTLSAGASFGEDATSLETLMARADQALYNAKAQGRARLVLWSDAARHLA